MGDNPVTKFSHGKATFGALNLRRLKPFTYRFVRLLGITLAVLALNACSARHLIIQGMANALAEQGQAPEDDLVLAREASAFYLKLSES